MHGLGALKATADGCTKQLGEIVGLVRGELTKLQRATLSALVVMDVHARDVVVSLAAQNLQGKPQDFAWLSQLRMYWEVSWHSLQIDLFTLDCILLQDSSCACMRRLGYALVDYTKSLSSVIIKICSSFLWSLPCSLTGHLALCAPRTPA